MYSSWRIAAPVFALLILTGCQTNTTGCAGWEKISLKPTTAIYLASNDVTAGQGIASHNRHGKNQGCWK